MKAWVLQANGQIEYKSTEKPQIKENEVLVEVKAAGICGSDIPRIYGGGAYFYPLIPGHEFSGQIAEVNAGDESLLHKRVGIFPLIPCLECEPCRRKQYEMCRHYSYLGSRCQGGFAEYAAVPKNNLIELPANVSYEEAAMLEPMSVAVHALRRANPSKDDTVVVCGLGTIGMFLLMFLIEMGIQNIYVIGNKAFQKEMALKAGISVDRFIDSGSAGTVSADVYFECVGKNETISQAISNTNPGGKVMFVGNPYTDLSLDKAIYWKILRNQLTVLGTWNSSFTKDGNDDWHYVLNKLSKEKVSPSRFISHRLSFEKLEEGLNMMKDKTEDYIKVMVVR